MSVPMRSRTKGYPLKQIVLDTETTGLNPKLGDRIIEIGCVELAFRRVSERSFHSYLNPERDVELGATRVHGLTREDLAAKPKFREVAREFLDFVRDAELLIHNAEFDVDFLNMELELAGFPPLREHVAAITDTLLFAKELHPGKKNSLDALCERYFVDNSRRTLHGAFADALLLGECYLAMTRGQESLVIERAIHVTSDLIRGGVKRDRHVVPVVRTSARHQNGCAATISDRIPAIDKALEHT